MTQTPSSGSQPESVFAAVCDLNGTLRGKRLPISQLDKVLAGGVRMPLSIACVDVWGEDIEGSPLVFETGDADGVCMATGRGPLPVTWTRKPSVMVPLWLAHEDGTPFQVDPRRILADVLSRYDKAGWTPVVATELEFYLMDGAQAYPGPPGSPMTGRRFDNDGVLALDELEHFDAFLDDVYEACAAQGVPADSAIAENGAGQFEVNMTHRADALAAADDAVLFKRIVRGVARKHGLIASFMAKPYGDRAGSGLHIHVSLLDTAGQNLFDDGTEAGTPLMQQAVAGLMQTMAETGLIYAPHENSYRRFLPGAHAPSSVAWAYENRTTAIRIPGGPSKARRIEHRTAGADSNPYLVMAAVLGGAFEGMVQGWSPLPPIQGNAYEQDLPELPPDWRSAIAAFDGGAHIDTIFGPQLRRLFTDCKLQEYNRFRRQVSAFEYATYLEVV